MRRRRRSTAVIFMAEQEADRGKGASFRIPRRSSGGDKEKTLHWAGVGKQGIVPESPQFTLRIRNHCTSFIKVTTAQAADGVWHLPTNISQQSLLYYYCIPILYSLIVDATPLKISVIRTRLQTKRLKAESNIKGSIKGRIKLVFQIHLDSKCPEAQH